ncbi:helix-turn-helix domain-containing protein [Flavobacterium sp. Fl-77]|uniref:Helix-turn-helix domain-containing protein n=1 Tax=Flavobacterium flavipigmentatum TaxID=2893884 RepID=A0AAJ2VW29_9FLAO|nr:MULTISPECIES: helix-turn-helix domain-containing protein [unclassified Flavobacterium]MDX6181524.1 helix-turn-helix domain-containing protein [Flavobacterium sp. Fl-33]MDX6185442.1 helix-turn-helix domain-containing protein [Flavobacterium sp. Fl-77]UFH37545.1 helix-turn-helix domain-containing protein [Flavobacterium sp. F-70]
MKTLLKNAREQKGFKTREVAQILGIDQALISKFETGTRKPTKEQVTKLAQLLEIDYETIMIAWLKEKILYEIGNEEFALKALLLAEKELQKNKKTIHSTFLTTIQSVLDEIETLKQQIQSFHHFDLHRISKILELEFISESNRLNGNSLTLEETKSVINEGQTITGKSMNEHLEAINLHESVAYIKDLNQKKVPITEKDFLNIHNLALRGIKPEKSGKYKNDPEIIREMNLFFNWYETNKNNLHPILLSSEAHLKILTVLPFEKGNLQIANLLMNWILLQNGYVFATIQGDEKHKNEYLQVVEQFQNTNDKSFFINYILQIEKENLIRAIDLVSK